LKKFSAKQVNFIANIQFLEIMTGL